MKRIVVIAAAVGVMSLMACGDDDGGGGSCESICFAAQDLNCTSISDCNEFCDVAQALAAKASCGAEYDAYHSCAQNTPTCNIDAQCNSAENAFFSCTVPWCYANQTDPDCIAGSNL